MFPINSDESRYVEERVKQNKLALIWGLPAVRSVRRAIPMLDRDDATALRRK